MDNPCFSNFILSRTGTWSVRDKIKFKKKGDEHLRTPSLILISAKRKRIACIVPEKRQSPALGIKIVIKKLDRLMKTQ